jgi:glycosyltransferase involved in cell wall biosynthesis
MNPKVLIDGRPAQGRPRGMGIYVLRLVEHLAALPEPPALQVALDRRAGPDPWPELTNLPRVWGVSGNPAEWEQRILPGLAGAAGVDLLHCTANASPWRSPVPVVVMVHDCLFLRPLRAAIERPGLRQALAHVYYRYGVGHGARRARLVLTNSEHSRQEIITRLRLPPERVLHVPLAEPYPTKPLPEEEHTRALAELQVDKPYILGLGALDRRKHTDDLVRAFARMPRTAVSMLVLAGFEQVERSSVPGLARDLDVAARIRIFGYLEPRLLTALFQGAAVFAYPSSSEGFGLPVLQAFGLGVPVVTSRTGAMPEVAGDAARLADPGDPRSLSQALMAVLSDSAEAHRLAYAGYLQAKRFSWETTAQRTLEAYRAALA